MQKFYNKQMHEREISFILLCFFIKTKQHDKVLSVNILQLINLLQQQKKFVTAK
jgi:hypothetical protein